MKMLNDVVDGTIHSMNGLDARYFGRALQHELNDFSSPFKYIQVFLPIRLDASWYSREAIKNAIIKNMFKLNDEFRNIDGYFNIFGRDYAKEAKLYPNINGTMLYIISVYVTDGISYDYVVNVIQDMYRDILVGEPLVFKSKVTVRGVGNLKDSQGVCIEKGDLVTNGSKMAFVEYTTSVFVNGDKELRYSDVMVIHTDNPEKKLPYLQKIEENKGNPVNN